MKNIIIHCGWDLEFDLYHEKQIELYVDCLPNDIVPQNYVRFVLLIEPPEIIDLSPIVIEEYNKGSFNVLLTHNSDLLKVIPNSHLFEFGTTWVKNYDFPQKKFQVSALVGGKVIAEGHKLRHKVWFKENRIKNIPKNFFLSNVSSDLENYNNHPILGKDKNPLFDSQFHICIENVKRDNWFTEKLIDCIQTKTIPIYYGCPNIGDWFNLDGIFIVNNLDDIVNSCNSLNENTYQEKINAIEDNFERVQKYLTIDDRLISKIQKIIQ